jgi:hypothetical protein
VVVLGLQAAFGAGKTHTEFRRDAPQVGDRPPSNTGLHWIPNGGVFSCLYYWDGVPLYDNLSPQQIATFPTGSNESCQVTQAFNTIIRGSDGTSYYVDGFGVAHWIQDGATYNCLVYGEGLPPWNNVTQDQVDTFAQGSWEPEMSC